MKSKSQRIIILLLILFGSFLIIGSFSDLFIALILYLLILLTFIGIQGGRWLWVRLASSPSFNKGIPWYIKMIGIIAILIFVIILAGGLKIYLVNDSTQINGIIDIGTKLMFFVAFYNLGYLISIWNIKKEITPSSNPNENLDEKSEEKNKPKSRLNFPFKIKKRLSIIVISMICIWIVISLFIAYSIDGIWFSNLFKYLATAGIGVGLGWIFWEHLKESNMLSGDFLKNLKLFSVLFEIPIIIFTILGIYFVKEGLTQYNQYLLLGYLLLFYLMATYFMGLLYETLKK